MTSETRPSPGAAAEPDATAFDPLASNAPEEARTAVVLLNMGGPERIESVRPFLRNIFADREIIRLPGGVFGQKLLGGMIVRRRIAEVEENYRKIGGASPILRWTRAQMEGLQERLNESVGAPVAVAMAMRYWHPFAGETLDALDLLGVDRVLAVTLYPHYTRATTGSSEADFRAAIAARNRPPALEVVREWYDHPGYLDLWAAKVQESLDALAPDVRDRVRLVVSAHGLPERFIRRGDPYVDHVRATMRGVLRRIESPPPASLCFQSRTGPVKWIGPGTEEEIARLAAAGQDAILVWPISFVSDHVETLFEVGMLFRETAESAGVRHYHVVPAFNDDPRFASVLAAIAIAALGARESGSGS